MTQESVRWEQRGHIGIITLNRPNERNALNLATLERFGELLELARMEQKEVRVVLIKAEGTAFCAGADLKERRTMSEQQVRQHVKKIRDVFAAVARLSQPTIAMINGYALGGGFELALACDFRYAVEEAQMGLTEVSLGIIPGAGGTQRLSRLIGPSRAKELILTARRISAQDAYALGIVNGVAKDADELEQRALSLADEILANAPLAVYQAKAAIDRGASVDLQTGLDLEAMSYEVIIPTKDRVEALEAFREKRKPVFRGE